MTGDAAFDGIAGDWATAVQPYTEADPIGVLAAYLVAAGNMIGPSPHVMNAARRHAVNEYVAIVGPSSIARKGDAVAAGVLPAGHADSAWGTERVKSGFGSGEGLVRHVEDTPDDGEAKDRRLLMKEGELASVLAVAARDGSTLSGHLRNAWDGETLENHTKGQSMRATGAHVSILACVTPDELRRKLTTTDVANGFGNRFLFVSVRRPHLLPRGGAIPDALVAAHATALRDRATTARKAGRLEFTDAGGELWDHAYGAELSVERHGMSGEVTARAETHALRLSMLYALLDGTAKIDRPHIEAALALWRYCEQSAYAIWGDSLGWPTADKILTAARDRGRLTGTGLLALFGRHAPPDLDAAIEHLVEKVRVLRVVTEQTGGRPATVYVPCDRSDISDQRSPDDGLSSHRSLSSRPEDENDGSTPASRCGHDTLWKARDGVLRCLDCEPPAFPAEVVA